jgi:hypothetical protein
MPWSATEKDQIGLEALHMLPHVINMYKKQSCEYYIVPELYAPFSENRSVSQGSTISTWTAINFLAATLVSTAKWKETDGTYQISIVQFKENVRHL